jgi:hypothetical protein
VPRVTDDALDCVIYLYPSVSEAEKGESVGGTGFLVGISSDAQKDADRCYVYAITNSHVIREGNSPVIRLKSKDGGHQILDIPFDAWVHHTQGDDVAACFVSPLPPNTIRKWINKDMWATRELVERYDIGPGDDVCMVGRFINHEGKQKNLPSVRFGNISMMPWEPFIHPRGIRQESYMIECRSLPGYSGSPVFVYESSLTLGIPRKEPLPFLLLGLDWCHPSTIERVREKDGKTPAPAGWVVNSNSGMAGVVPAWKIEELLNEDPFKATRKANEDRILKM